MPRRTASSLVAGSKYGYLTAVRSLEGSDLGRNVWVLRCDCGQEAIAQANPVLRGDITSCKCKRNARFFRHGMYKSPEYRAWSSMISRCKNPGNASFADYGGRGIAVCDEWAGDFTKFFEDMGPRPSPKHQIDRIDNDGSYEVNNCRWATPSENSRNRRNTIFVECDGEVKTLAEWSYFTGIGYQTLRKRLNAGWDAKRALTHPVCNTTVARSEHAKSIGLGRTRNRVLRAA